MINNNDIKHVIHPNPLVLPNQIHSPLTLEVRITD